VTLLVVLLAVAAYLVIAVVCMRGYWRSQPYSARYSYDLRSDSLIESFFFGAFWWFCLAYIGVSKAVTWIITAHND
jgi:hypothetical protein